MARCLVLKPYIYNSEDAIYEAEINELNDFYKHLECDCFDVANRQVGDSRYDCYVDDVGLFTDKMVSAIAINPNGSIEPMLVGNIIFANHDMEGNTTSLSDEDIENILSNLGAYHTSEGKQGIAVKCDY